jgi:hypothetical protein
MTPIWLTGGRPNGETQSRGHVHPHHVSLRAVVSSASIRPCRHCKTRRRAHPRHASTAHTRRVRHVHACPQALPPIVGMRWDSARSRISLSRGDLTARFDKASPSGRSRFAPGSGLIRPVFRTDSPHRGADEASAVHPRSPWSGPRFPDLAQVTPCREPHVPRRRTR